jgi:hypothetical protein
MGLDIYLECPACRREIGSSVYITYNYSSVYARLVEEGVFDPPEKEQDAWFGKEKANMLGFLDEKRAGDVVDVLARGVAALSEAKPNGEDGWAATDYNARAGLEQLLEACRAAPTAVISVSR